MTQPIGPDTRPRNAGYDQKARLLLSLLDTPQLEQLRRRGLDLGPAGDHPAGEDPQASMAGADDREAWHRNRLLQRLRENGLLAETGGPAASGANAAARSAETGAGAGPRAAARNPAPAGGSARGEGAAAAPPPVAPQARAALTIRLAEHLNEATLAEEHPAVIAHLLAVQSPALRARVLRDLPGPQARAVMRQMKGLNRPA